jgi:hypothetical protein
MVRVGMPRRLAYGIVAVTLGYLLVEPLLSSFDVLEWPVVKRWATSHESTLVTAATVSFLAWATLTLAVYGCLLLLDKRLRSH